MNETEKGTGVGTHEVTVDFVSECEQRDTYVVAVPLGLTKEEVQKVLEEATMLSVIADCKPMGEGEYYTSEGVQYTAEQVESAKSALECYGNGAEAYMVYINECYGWKYRPIDVADFEIRY